MDEILQSEVFFFISSIGFVILGILAIVFLFYLIRATRIFYRIMERAEEDIDEIGDTTKEMLEEIQDSAVFRFLFRRKRKRLK